MARPVAADAAQTRARILRQASLLFAEAGEGSVSVRKVADEAGVSLATVHHYFGTKAKLYDACVLSMQDELEELRLELIPTVVQAEEPEAALDAAVRRAFRFAVERQGAVRLLMRTVIDTGRQIEGRLHTVHIPFLEQAALLLGNFSEHSQFKLRMTVQSAMHLLVRYALTDADELQAITQTKTTKDAFQTAEDHLVWSVRQLLGLEERP